MCCMKFGGHKMKIKSHRTNNKTYLKRYLKLVLFKTAREHIRGAFKNFSYISLKHSLTVRCIFFFVSYYYFVYLLRKWFVTSVLISERLIFSKLDFKALWRRFQSDKHFFNIAKRSYFSALKSRLFSWYVLKHLVLWNWLV